jgi:hypothetical protein
MLETMFWEMAALCIIIAVVSLGRRRLARFDVAIHQAYLRDWAVDGITLHCRPQCNMSSFVTQD